MEMDEKEKRRRAMMGGAKGAMSATVSTMQTTGGKGAINGENDTMQMMRQAVRQKMIASASQKKLLVEQGEGVCGEGEATAQPSAPAPPAVAGADARAAFKKRSFSASMPAHVMRNVNDTSLANDGGENKAMGSIIKGLDELSDADSMTALRYIMFTCEKLGLDASSLPCAQKVMSAEASLKGTYKIAEEEEELSLDDMVSEPTFATNTPTLNKNVSAAF